jgi:hypothetical protein
MNGVAVVHRISCTAIEPRHGRGGTARQIAASRSSVLSNPSLSNRFTPVLTSLFTPQIWILLLLAVTEPFEENHRSILGRGRPMYITGNLYTFQTRESSFELELAVTAAQPVHMKTPDSYALVLEDDAYLNAHYLQTEQPT